MAVPTFVDRVVLHVAGGKGGNGVASVHREKFKPLGGPDGGNGGHGGDVILRVDPDVTTLLDYHHSPKRRAEHGGAVAVLEAVEQGDRADDPRALRTRGRKTLSLASAAPPDREAAAPTLAPDA